MILTIIVREGEHYCPLPELSEHDIHLEAHILASHLERLQTHVPSLSHIPLEHQPLLRALCPPFELPGDRAAWVRDLAVVAQASSGAQVEVIGAVVGDTVV